MLQKASLVSLLLMSLAMPIMAQHTLGHTEVRFVSDTMEAVQETALSKFNGDYIVFRFDESPQSKTLERIVLGDDEIAGYINTNFARIALPLEDQSEGAQKTSIEVASTQHTRSIKFFSPPEDRFDTSMLELILEQLMMFKSGEDLESIREAAHKRIR